MHRLENSTTSIVTLTTSMDCRSDLRYGKAATEQGSEPVSSGNCFVRSTKHFRQYYSLVVLSLNQWVSAYHLPLQTPETASSIVYTKTRETF
jgi:hypothetical protein